MPLKAQLMEDMKNAMRSGDTVKRDTVRFLMAAVKNFEIDNGEQDDEGVQKVVAREVKKMNEAIIEFEKGDRQDLADADKAKVAVLQAYLPQQMSAEELDVIVKQTIDEAPDKNFGLVMKAVMAKVQGKADGGAVSAAVKKLLG